MSSVEESKHALLAFARTHDTERAARRKPWLMGAAAAGTALVLTRLATRTARRGLGGRLMGVLLLGRLALRYAPILMEGVRQAQPAVFFLEKNVGRYTVGDDSIEFGPGRADHQRTSMEGASYGAHRGNLKTDGDCVYLTGFTPFREKITIR